MDDEDGFGEGDLLCVRRVSFLAARRLQDDEALDAHPGEAEGALPVVAAAALLAAVRLLAAADVAAVATGGDMGFMAQSAAALHRASG